MSKSLSRQIFGANAREYATSPVHAKGASLTRLVELVKPQCSWHALDIATAAGHTALAFAPHVASIIASDLTPEMLEQATKLAVERGITNLSTRLADAEDLPFEPSSFDLVTCRIASHHFPDIAAFVREVSRVLRPGGIFGLVDNISPDEHSAPGFSASELERAGLAYNAFERLRDPSHVTALTMKQWHAYLSITGFQIGQAERLAKEMAFQPWAERLGAAPETISKLRNLLDETGSGDAGPHSAGADDTNPALQAFLKPRLLGGALQFTLEEAVIIAMKPNS